MLEQVCLEALDGASGVPRAQIMAEPHISGLASCLSQVWKLSWVPCISPSVQLGLSSRKDRESKKEDAQVPIRSPCIGSTSS